MIYVLIFISLGAYAGAAEFNSHEACDHAVETLKHDSPGRGWIFYCIPKGEPNHD